MDNTELIAEAKEFAKIKDGEYPEYEDELEHIILGLCSALEQVEAEREGKVLVDSQALKKYLKEYRDEFGLISANCLREELGLDE
jgi:hypothetical protein